MRRWHHRKGAVERRLQKDAVRAVIERFVDEIGGEDGRDERKAHDQPPAALGEGPATELRAQPG